jgi:ABC-type uncharacterized transport system involved in gliding motility auxiliary subunit
MQTAVIAIMGLISLVIGLVLMLVLPGIRVIAWGIMGLGIIFLAAAFIIEFRRVRGALVSKRGKFGTSTTIMVSILIGIILLVNAISISSYHRFDFTGLSQFTLTSQTKDVLAKLEAPVEVLCFFVPNDAYGIASYATSLLEEYKVYADQLSVKTIDPDEHPDQARQYGITQYQTVVFKGPEGNRLVYPEYIITEAEHAFTSSILEVTGITQKKVYFLTGHGEASIISGADNGYSTAREGLLDNLYQVDTLDLLITRSIPDDCATLVIAGPVKSLTNDEVEIIKDYLENSGRALILTNPDSPPEIKALVSPWGIKVEDGTLIDTSSYAAPSIESPSVPRTRNLFELSVTYFPGATAIVPEEEMPENLQVAPLVWTSKDSWLERNYDPDNEPAFDEGTDLKGPLAIGVFIATGAPEGSEEEIPEEEQTRLVVIGDSDFATNQHFLNGNNSDLFLSSVNWLTVGAELISIDRKVLQTRRLIIGPEGARFLNISSIGLLPIIILVIGGVIWWRRR